MQENINQMRIVQIADRERLQSILCYAHRTRLLKEQTKSLEEWLHKDNKTEPELMYWIPKYIRMRGTTQFAEIGDISATMQHIAESQDKIGWRHFTEGCISKKFHRRQRFFLQMSSNRLNGTDYAFNRYEVVILAPHVADVSPTCRRHR
jgi:mannose-6-phosphate isomerase class I